MCVWKFDRSNCFPPQIVMKHRSHCSQFTHKSTSYKEYENRNCYEGTSSQDKGLREVRDRVSFRGAGKTFRISNFINVKVIPSRDSLAGKSFLHSLREVVPHKDYKHTNRQLKSIHLLYISHIP